MTALFEVLPNAVYGPNGEYTEGMQIELPEAVESAFPDKLKRVVEPVAVEPLVALSYLTVKQVASLASAGFATQADLDTATNEAILAVEGIGDVALSAIRLNAVKG